MAAIEAISTVYLEDAGAEASYIIWDNIPSTYEHLEIHMNAQSNRASYGNDAVIMRLGSDAAHEPVDTGANYSYHIIETNTTTTLTQLKVTGATSMFVGRIASGHAGAANFGNGIISILHYSSPDKNTTVMGLGGMTSGGGTTANDTKVRFTSGLWANASIVNAIHIQIASGNAWNRGSELTLYGLNGS